MEGKRENGRKNEKKIRVMEFASKKISCKISCKILYKFTLIKVGLS